MSAIANSDAVPITQPGGNPSAQRKSDHVVMLVGTALLTGSALYSPKINFILNLHNISVHAKISVQKHQAAINYAFFGMYVTDPLFTAKISHVAAGALNVHTGIKELLKGNTSNSCEKFAKAGGKFCYAAALIITSPEIMTLSLIAIPILGAYSYYNKKKSLNQLNFFLDSFQILQIISACACTYLHVPVWTPLFEANAS